MKTIKYLILTFLFVFFKSSFCLAQDLVIYPAQGQTQEQTEKDKYECYAWAKQQSGFDPMQQPVTTTPPLNSRHSKVV